MAIPCSKGKDQPGKVANPARGQLNTENAFFPCLRSRLRIWSREPGSAIPYRANLLISILRLNLMLTYYGISPEFHGGVHSSFFSTAIRHRVSPEFIGSCNCVPMAFTAESPPARKPQGSSKRVLPWQITMNQLNTRISFPHPLLV